MDISSALIFVLYAAYHVIYVNVYRKSIFVGNIISTVRGVGRGISRNNTAIYFNLLGKDVQGNMSPFNLFKRSIFILYSSQYNFILY